MVLLDIRMPGVDGLQVASQLAGWERRPAVVFTTAYDEYAIQAFEAQAVGYLLKPVRRERLQQTLEHATRVGRAQLLRIPGAAPRTHICVQRTRGLQMIPVEDILCFQADQKYVTAHYSGGEALLDEPLKDLEDEFGDRFLRIHRNALVAVAWLDSLERDDSGSLAGAAEGRLPPAAGQPPARGGREAAPADGGVGPVGAPSGATPSGENRVPASRAGGGRA